MDLTTLDLARSGLEAQQTRVDVAGHNLANAQTPGFRALRPELVDLPAAPTVFGLPAPARLTQANDPTEGVNVAQIFQPELVGPVLTTNAPLDVALPGGIYLAVTMPNGQTGYTRNGQLSVGPDGALQAGDNRLAGTLRVPAASGSPYLDEVGQVLVNGAQGAQVIGALPLFRIPNPEQLQNLGLGLASPTPNSGTPVAATRSDLTGLVPAALEGSNVQADRELTALMRAHRAYQANAQMVHTWNELVGATIQDLGHA